MQRAKDLSKRWRQDIVTTKGILTNAAKRGDSSRLAELQRLGGKRTTSQNQEFNKLQNEIAKNYELGGELVGKIIGTSLINMGVGSIALLGALKENPKETLIALPPAIFLGVKEDFNRVMSGDPLEIGSVGLEYYTFAKFANIVGKVGKAGLRTSYGIGRKLSPKYFGAVSKKLLIPAATLGKVAVKTAAGRAANRAVRKSLKQTGVVAKVKDFNKVLKILRPKVDRKIATIIRKGRTAKGKQVKILATTKTKIRYIDDIKRLQKRRKQNLDYWKIKWAKRTFKSDQAIDGLEDIARSVGKFNAVKYLKAKSKAGYQLTKEQSKLYIDSIGEVYVKTIRKTGDYKTLEKFVKLNNEFSIRIPKPHRLARNVWNNAVKMIVNLKMVKFLKSTWNKAKNNLLRPVRTVRRKVKEQQKKEIRKFKNAVEIQKELRQAKLFRRKFAKRPVWKTKLFGNDDYAKLLEFSEEFTINIARVKAKRFINAWKKSGRKLGLGVEENFIKKAQDYALGQLKKSSAHKNLKQAVKINKPFAIQLRKVGKLNSAKKISIILGKKIKGLTIPRKIQAVGRKFRAVKKKLSPKIMRSRIGKRIAVAKGRRMYRKTIKYRMLKARPIRKVTVEQLNRTASITNMNNFIDRLFKEIATRQSISISKLQYSQLKNILKKRVKKAIKSGDKKEMARLRSAFKQLIINMNKKSSQPKIKAVGKSIPTRKVKGQPKPEQKIRKIDENFDPDIPAGNYVEVRSGDTIMLQRVDVKMKTAQPIMAKLKVKTVVKSKAYLGTLVKFAALSFVGAALVRAKTLGAKVGTMTDAKVLALVMVDAKTDIPILKVIGTKYDVPVKTLIDTAVKTAVRTRLRPLRPKTITKTKKKPVIPLKLKKEKNTRKLSKKVMTYGFVVKKKGKIVKLKIPPLTLQDAWDVGAKRLDYALQRTGKLIPLGMNDVVAKIPKTVKNYYSKNSKKFRRFRKKRGKILTLERTIIERKKYIGDKPSEIKALRRERSKRAIRKPTKRKPLTPSQRKTAIQRLKKQKAMLMRRRKIIKRRITKKHKRKK